MTVERIDISCIEIEDRPGSLQKILVQAAEAGVDLLCFTAFSTRAGIGKIYLSAKDEQFFEVFLQRFGHEARPFSGFVISGTDRVGAAADALKGLAGAGINGRVGAAMVCGGSYQMLIVVDESDADVAEKALRV